LQLYKLVERNLSEIEERTIEHFMYYFDDKRCFALIGEYVIAALSDENCNNLENLKQEAAKNMDSLIHTPPDFSTYVMDDMFGLISMNFGIYGVTSEPLSDEEIETGKMNIAAALAVRSLCLEACQRGIVIAINDEEL